MRRVAAAGALAALLAFVVTAAAGASSPAVVQIRNVLAADIRAPGAGAAPAALAAWCGAAAETDRAPNVVAGNPIHWVYLIPSDGSDNLGEVATVMQSDAEQVDAWWRGQDSTRVPRNDLATFPCGTQLDITTVRSPRSGPQLAPLSGRFSHIFDSLQQAGLTSVFTKYLVYYDGPADESIVCGQGGSNANGFGVAIVYYRSCVGVSTAAVAAHEFLHTTGAVSDRAPNACTGESSGHTCDSEADLMYPAIGDEALAGKLLDPGRDDYYGHPGQWTDSQDTAWLVRLDAQAPLAVTISGPGSVSADVPGLECAASCTATWNAGQRLALSATPGAGAKLVRWGGACSGGADCALTVAPGVAVSALFAPSAFRLAVTIKGRGVVRSTAGISCRTRCSVRLASFQPVRLAATPAKGWMLRSWSGACKGTRSACTVPMSAATSVRATFVRT